MKRLSLLAAGLCLAARAAGVTSVERAWEKPFNLPVESELLSDRLEEPQSHFLTDGMHAFVAGRDFYQATGDLNPFLWPANPFARLWPDRDWIDDSSAVSVKARGGGPAENAFPGGAPAFSAAEVAWQALSELRLRAAVDENDLYSGRSLPARRAMAEKDGMSWLGGELPLQSRAGAGAVWSHRGTDIAFQYDQGYWWTVSPASGVAYPWKGFNADFLYRVGEEVDISLRDQEWDAAAADSFQGARWRRSDLNLGFNSEGPGGWMTRLELGYQRRALFSDSAFAPFEEKTYPVRFRYRQVWAPGGDSSFTILSRGSIGYREQMFTVEHAEELTEKWGRQEPSQFLRAYYREPVGSRPVPTEYFPGDSAGARTYPGENARGVAGGAEYRYRFPSLTLGAAVDGAMEWALPVFRLERLDTVDGLLRRTGAYRGSDYALGNGSARAFVSGRLGLGRLGPDVTWRLHGGLRAFAGHDADAMEFQPSPWWLGGEAGWKSSFGLRLAAGAAWLGPKEVRGWGALFEVPAHWENSLALEQMLLAGRLKLSASFVQIASGEVREHPNGSPLGFRVLARAEAGF
jgi:hypothetical protein